MEDVIIVFSARMGKASITGQTDRGKRWVLKEMVSTRIAVDASDLKDLINTIQGDGLTVIVR